MDQHKFIDVKGAIVHRNLIVNVKATHCTHKGTWKQIKNRFSHRHTRALGLKQQRTPQKTMQRYCPRSHKAEAFLANSPSHCIEIRQSQSEAFKRTFGPTLAGGTVLKQTNHHALESTDKSVKNFMQTETKDYESEVTGNRDSSVPSDREIGPGLR